MFNLDYATRLVSFQHVPIIYDMLLKHLLRINYYKFHLQAPDQPAVPTDSGDSDLLNQGRYTSAPPSRGRRNINPEATVAPPTEGDIPTRCLFPQNDFDQFIYVYELWIGIWYTNQDIQVIRGNLSPY